MPDDKKTVTSAKVDYQTRMYQQGMKDPKRASMNETPDMKVSRLQKQYPLARTGQTGRKTKRF